MDQQEYVTSVNMFKILARTIRLDPPQAEMLWGDVNKSKSLAKSLRKEIKKYEAETGANRLEVEELDIMEVSNLIKNQLSANENT